MKQITRWMLALLALVGLQSTFTQAQQLSPKHDNSLSSNQAQVGDDPYPFPDFPDPNGEPTSDGVTIT